MPIVREESHNLTGGEVTSPPPHLVGVQEALSAQNLDPRDLRGATTRNGRSQHGSNFSSDAAFDGLKHWIQGIGSGGAGTAYLGSSHLIGRIGTTFYDFISGVAASIGIGGTQGSIARMAPLNDVLCIVVDGLAPKQYDGTNFANLTGTPPAEAKFAVVHMSKLWLAGDDANPQTKKGSATNNPNDYTTSFDAVSITTQDGGGDTIQGLASNRLILLTFYRNFTDYLAGNSYANFSEQRLIDRGLVSPTGYTSAGEVVFFASDDAIYMVSGAQVTDITTGKMRTTYRNISDKSKISLGLKGDLLLVVDYGADTAYACAYKFLRWSTWTGQAWKVMDTANDQTFYAGADGGSTTQIWKLDTGSLDGAASITAHWRTPNLGFGWPDCPKNLAQAKIHAKPGMPTTTITWYKNGASIGSQNILTFATAAAGEHAWDTVAGQSKVRGQFLGMKIEWTGAGTLYGWTLYAEVTADEGEVPAVS